MADDTKSCKFIQGIDLEKMGVYLGLLVTFVTAMIYIADIKERIATLETKVEELEKK